MGEGGPLLDSFLVQDPHQSFTSPPTSSLLSVYNSQKMVSVQSQSLWDNVVLRKCFLEFKITPIL